MRARARFFLECPVLLNYVNAGRFAVVQVMSGRSEDNSVFDSGGREFLLPRSGGERMGAEPAYRELLANEGPEHARAVVEETRANWVKSFSALLEAIEVPTVLFWFSKRSPDFEDDYSDVVSMFGEFPHLVNRAMVEQIGRSATIRECVSARGFPQRLFNRFTGEPASVTYRPDWATWQGIRRYYPSPEMHFDAAETLAGGAADQFVRVVSASRTRKRWSS